MELQQVTSTLLDSVGFNAEESLLFVRFKGKDDVYSFANIPPEMYEEMVTSKSVGQFFSQNIKPFKDRFPYEKMGSEIPAVADIDRTATDFTATGPVPAIVAPAEIVLADDPEALKAQALELSERTKAIAIVSPEAYALAGATLTAIARMRDGLERTLRPEIDRAHKIHAAACAVLNHYDKPLAADAQRLKDGMRDFKKHEDDARLAAERADRQRQQEEADAEAKRKAQELQIGDAIEAESRGETQLAKVIMDSAPLPVAPRYVPPVSYASTVPKVKGVTHVPNWTFEIEDETKIPRKYLLVNEAALRSEAKKLMGLASVEGVRFYDAGTVRSSKK